MTPEGKVKAKVNKMLAKYESEVYRFMPVQMGMGAPSLDYLICAGGRFVAVETKVPGKKLTPRQEQTAHAMECAGARVVVVRDDAGVAFLEAILDKFVGWK